MIYPKHINFVNWANSLIIDFPDQNIPSVKNELEWKKWGNSLLALKVFSSENISPTNNYNNWEDWAKDFFLIMYNHANKK